MTAAALPPPALPSPRIGIDLGGTKIAGAIVARDLQRHCYRRIQSPRNDYRATVSAVTELVAELRQAFTALPGGDERSAAALPVGIGTPGSLCPVTGALSNSNSTWLNGQPLLADLERALGGPVALANDADCFALAQWQLRKLQRRDQSGSWPRDTLCFGVILGTGVGGGWCHAGALRSGPNRLAGEWGHMPLPYLRHAGATDSAALEAGLADRACYCGRLNCIETFLSGPGFLQTHRQLWGAQATEQDAAAIFAGSAPRCIQSSELYCDMLARSLGQVVNAIDPDVIVLGGGLSNAALLYDALPQRMPAYLFDRAVLHTPIQSPLDGADSGVIGAALLCDGPFYQDR